jgi:hypothetical protein
MMTSLFDVLLNRPRHQSHGGQPWMTSLADDTQTDGYSHAQGSHEWRHHMRPASSCARKSRVMSWARLLDTTTSSDRNCDDR